MMCYIAVHIAPRCEVSCANDELQLAAGLRTSNGSPYHLTCSIASVAEVFNLVADCYG